MGTVNTYSGSSAVATKNGYSISCRFTSSFQKDKPVLSVFTIILERKKDELRPPIRRHIVEPPSGYEDYDMKPEDRVSDFANFFLQEESKNINYGESRNKPQRYHDHRNQGLKTQK